MTLSVAPDPFAPGSINCPSTLTIWVRISISGSVNLVAKRFKVTIDEKRHNELLGRILGCYAHNGLKETDAGSMAMLIKPTFFASPCTEDCQGTAKSNVMEQFLREMGLLEEFEQWHASQETQIAKNIQS